MDDWNPMMADFNDPYFNRYSQGVGRNLLSGNRTTAQVFVDNFPVEVGEEGLRNIFSDFGLVHNAELKPSNRPDKRHTFGFVQMADPAAAAEAISVLNGHRFHFSPYSLRVMPAITNEEKERRKKNKQIERDIMGPYADSDAFSLPDDARSRRSFEYGHPSLQRSLLGQYDGRSGNMQYGPGWAFGNRGNMLPLGRGRQMGDQFRGPSAPFMGRGQKLLDYISRDPGRGRGVPNPPGGKAPPRVSQAGSHKQCVHCGQEESVNRCSRCKMYYCSLECQRKDWPNHKNICMDVSLHHQTLYGADPFAASIENHKGNLTNGAPGAYPGAKSGQKNKDKDTVEKRNQLRKPEEQGPKNQSSAKTFGNKSKQNAKDQSSESASSNARYKENGGKRQNVKNRGDNEQNDSGENGQSSRNMDESKNKDSADSQKKRFNKGKNQFKDDRQGDKKEREALKESEAVNQDSKAVNGTDEDDQRGSGKSYEKMNGEKRKTEKVSEEKKARKSNAVDGSGDAPCDLERDTLPLNGEVECYLSFYKNPDMFWVMKKENMIPFFDTTQFFTESIKDLPKISAHTVKEGDLCCLLYEEEWSRAKVMKILDDNKAVVIFSDYGNQEVVDKSSLLPLAPEMRQLPTQAIYCCLSGLKPKQAKWGEEASAVVRDWFGEPLTKEFKVTYHGKEASKSAVDITCDSATPNSLRELLLTKDHATPSDILKADVNQNVKKKKDSSPVKRFRAHELKSFVSELNVGDEININIMLFKSIKHFVGQILDKITALPDLEEMMAKKKLEQDAPYKPAVGEIVLAKYHVDNSWYRSEVTNIKGDTYNIIFIDYGNEESVSSSDIRQIQDASLLKFPRFALSFGMQGFEDMNPSQKVLDEFAVLLEEYTVQTGIWKVVILEKRKSIVIVDFKSDKKTESLSEALCKKLSPKKDSPQKVSNKPKLDVTSSSPRSPVKSSPSPKKLKASENTKDQTSCPIQTESLPDLDTALTKVTVLYVVDLNNFYVGLSDKQVSLNEMMVELNQTSDSLVGMEKAQKGSLAAVKFEDGLWYRVQVLSIQEGTCSVFFIDYGNTETFKTEYLHVLPDLALTTSAQAIHCSLDLKSDMDDSDVLSQLKSLENGEVDVRVLKRVKDLCMLQVCKPDGSDLLQTQKKTVVQSPVKSSPSPKKLKASENTKDQTSCPIQTESLPDLDTALTKVTVLYVVDLNNFYVGLSDKQVSLNEMMVELNQTSDSLVGMEKAQKGSLAAVKFEDGLWYRVQVLSIQEGTCSVFFIDFGNSETFKTECLHVLPDLALTTSAQAIHCSLDLKSDMDDSDVLSQLKSLENGEVDVRVLKRVKDLCMLQVCKPDGSDLLQTQKKTVVQKKKMSAAATPLLSDLEEKEHTGTDVRVICVYFKDVNEFYCLKEEDIPEVSKLTEKLDLYFKTSEVDVSQEPIVKGLYACYFENQWFRCVVEEVKGDEVSVKYIDFGNTETRSIADLKPLDHEFLTQPISVFKCKLNGIQILDGNNGSQEMEQYNLMLMKQVQVNELYVKIESKDSDIYLVSLCISSKTGQNIDIASDLVSVGLAKWTVANESLQQKPEGPEEEEEEEEEDADEDDRKMQELMRQMEELKLRKKKKTAK